MDELITSKFSWRELRPCDNCGGPVKSIFRIVEIKHAVVNAKNLNAFLGTMLTLGPRSANIAEAMSPGADAVFESMDNEEAVTRLLICNDCFCRRDMSLAMLAEKRNEKRKEEAARPAGNS